MKKTKNFIANNKKKIIVFLFIIASLFRLWLICSTNWSVNIDTYYDSHLGINQAVNIIAGNWLGAYTKFTLCKNPIYPIFLAILYFLHIPYTYGISLLMIGASFLFIKAIKPVIKSDWLSLLIYIFILYNPVWKALDYHYRNSLSSWLILAIIGCVIAIYLRREKRIKEILPYSIIGLISMGSFWLLREDSIWIVPFLLVAYLIGLISVILKKQGIKKIIAFAIVSLLPLGGIVVFNNAISFINYKVYGVYLTNDRTQGNISKLLGTLIRIDDGSDLDNDVWISSKTLELAKEASPTFAKLDLSPFDNWPKMGDLSIWAIRDVLTNSGYFIDAKETKDVCGKIVDELNEAFKNGKLKKKNGVQLSDTSGMFSYNEMVNSVFTSANLVKNHIRYSDIKLNMINISNYNNESDLLLYEEVLGINLFRNEARINDKKVSANDSETMFRVQNENHYRAYRYNKSINEFIISIYSHTDIIIFSLSIIGFIYIIIKLIKKDKQIEYKFESLLIMVGLLLVTYVNAYMICVWATSFSKEIFTELVNNYSMEEYLLISLFEVFGIIYFVKFIKELINRKKEKNKDTKKSNFSEFIGFIIKLDFKNLFRTKTNNTCLQFFRYLFVGGFAAVVNVGMLYIFTDICHIYYIISNVLAFILGLLTNYILSKKFVFQDDVSINKYKEFIIYAIIGVIGLGIDTLFVWIFTDLIMVYYIVSKIISTAIVFIWNFGARKTLYKIIK